ncbi:hypothetical protein LTR86_001032 [Recurvomyces mirabilis]|nr:hypothetical protein LTR86_001032 [Recurvomyces mirabilis]
MRPAIWVWLIAVSCGISHASQTPHEQQPLTPASGKQPNIVLFLSDDQDLWMQSWQYMPRLMEHISQPGLSFRNHHCTNALCCPSRVSLWTGKAAHNTNVTDVNPPHGKSVPDFVLIQIITGGYPKFASQGFNSAYLPIWLQEAGYNTYYVGKLFNAQTVDNYHSPHAAGWTASEFLLDPFTYEYLNATLQRNEGETHFDPVSYEGQYSTDIVAEKAYGFLQDGLKGFEKDGKPFFLVVAPIAPHTNVHFNEKIHGNFSEKSVVQSPPVPAKRHEHLFEDVVVPRTPHFNPDEPNGVSWISRLPKQNSTNVDSNDNHYRRRLQSLQAVDEMVNGVVTRMSKAEILDDSFVIYTTDNGYHIGQHRLQPGKQCAFREDVNIPLFIRGPGVLNGITSIYSSHIDLAPTIMKLSHAKLPSGTVVGEFDGQPVPLTYEDFDEHIDTVRSEHVEVEMWGIIMSEGNYGSVLYPNHTYKALRLAGHDYSFLYTVWCSGEHELYDLTHDVLEMHNLYQLDHSTPFTFNDSSHEAADNLHFAMPDDFPNVSLLGAFTANNLITSSSNTATLSRIIARLDTLLVLLKLCKGRQCTHPWEVLHPDGSVKDLHAALDQKYDLFYEVEQERVRFDKCEMGYIKEVEGPGGVKTWDGELRGGTRWQDLT